VTLRVFGRIEYPEPLTEIGTVEDGADLLTEFPGDWVELIAFPERAVEWIIRDGVEVEDD
jgi:hypothetical protein